jgi:hypothetical protein
MQLRTVDAGLKPCRDLRLVDVAAGLQARSGNVT